MATQALNFLRQALAGLPQVWRTPPCPMETWAPCPAPAHCSIALSASAPRALPGREFSGRLPSNGENDKWDSSCYQHNQGEHSVSSSSVGWTDAIELLLLCQSLMTKLGPRGPAILQNNKVTPRSYLQGSATLHMYRDSASAPLPCASRLHVNKAGEAALRMNAEVCAGKFLAPQFPGIL